MLTLMGLLWSGTARAAAPEAPQLEVTTGSATTANLRGVLYPGASGEAGSYEFLYRKSASECQGESKAPASPGLATGVHGEEVSETLTGLLPGTHYTVCLSVSNGSEATLSAPVTFTTLAQAPTIVEASVLDVSSSQATLQATIDPGGAATSYVFEYAPAGGSFEPVVNDRGTLPAGAAGVAVSVRVEEGLAAHASYQFRVIAANAVKTVTSEAVAFTMQTTGGELELPDGRQWEMVSPPNKHGADLRPLSNGIGNGGVIQAAQSGDAFTYFGNSPTEAEPQRSLSYLNTQILSRRGPEGWVSQDINPSGTEPVYAGGNGHTSEYVAFTPDLSEAIVEPFGDPPTPLAPEVTEQTPYVRDNVACETTTSCYTPLAAPSDLPPGTKTDDGLIGSVEFSDGWTPDMRHIVLHASGIPLPHNAGYTAGLYEWSEGKLEQVGILPESEGGGEAGFGAFLGQKNANGEVSQRHAISDDGSRIFWDDQEFPRRGGLYVRDTAKHETLRIGQGEETFQDANVAGTRAFFNSGDGFLGGTLSVCEIIEVAGKLACEETQLAPSVMGLVGESEDGSYVYFASDSVLAPGAVAGNCAFFGAPAGALCNVYEEHRGTGGWEAPQLVAVISRPDLTGWEALIEYGVRVSPDGRWLAFMSDRSLTGYDSRDAVSGEPDEEVYLYHAAPAAAGKLVCASCDPTGARPEGERSGGPAGTGATQEGQLIDPAQPQGQAWLAGNIPGWDEINLTGDAWTGPTYEPRDLSDSGRLFFDSSDALVPQDVNGTWDVYEYEPAGVGGCSSSSRTFGERSSGCAGLISAGTSPEESAFLDASETGGDIFFLTASELAPQDVDTSLDVYDAHECATASPCISAPVTPPACASGDSCKAPPSPQPAIYGAPASETFSGSGNVTPVSMPAVSVKPLPKRLTGAQKLARALQACRLEARRKRAACERAARRRYAHAAIKSHTTTRANQRGAHR